MEKIAKKSKQEMQAQKGENLEKVDIYKYLDYTFQKNGELDLQILEIINKAKIVKIGLLSFALIINEKFVIF